LFSFDLDFAITKDHAMAVLISRRHASTSGNSYTTPVDATPSSAVPAVSRSIPTPVGLLVSDSGYTFTAENTLLHDHGDPLLTFAISGPDGRRVTQFRPVDGTEMHLVAVRRDLSNYRHLHPTMSPDGTWSAPLQLPSAGSYRAFVQFMPSTLGRVIILGVDLAAGGYFTPQSPLAPTRAAQVGDGDNDRDDLDISVNGWLHAGQENDISFTFSRDGLPVTDLQRYQEGYAQLVALREGDLAVQIAQPVTTGSGPDIGFRLGTPGPGTYRLFLEFKYGGTVTTAALTMVAQ